MDAMSVVDSKFIEVECLFISEADFSFYVFSFLLKYMQIG